MRDILNSNGINVFVNTISAQEPLEVETDDNTSSTMKIKDLNGFGSAGQIIRSSGTALGYSNVCNLQNILTTKSGGGLRFYEYTENDGAGTTNLITIGNATDSIKFIQGDKNITLPNQTGVVQLAVSVDAPLLMASDNIKLDFSTISETDPSDDDFLLLNASTSSTSFFKNKYSTFKNGIALDANLPIFKDSNNKYSFSISQLGSSNATSLTSTLIIAESDSDSALKKLTFSGLGDLIIPAAINFGTDTTSTNNRTFGNSVRDTAINAKTLRFQTQGVEKITLLDNLLTMSNSSSMLLLGSSVDSNALSNVNTTSVISSIHDLHLLSVGQTYAGSLNRFCCISGADETETAIFGYAGSNISIANGGIPNPEDSNNPRKSVFTMTTGTDSAYSIVNRSGTAFSTTTTQFTIKGTDTNFWTENVIVNGDTGSATEATIKLNTNGGNIQTFQGRSIVGRDNSTGLIFLGNAVDNSELFSTTTFGKIISLSNHLDSNATNLVLKCASSTRILIENSGSKRIIMGEKAEDFGSSASLSPKDALYICNKAATTDFQACRLGIESRISTKDPVLEMYANSGSDSTANRGFIFWNNSLNWNIGSDTNAGYTKILNNFWSTGGTTSAPRGHYFANCRSDLNQGIRIIWGTDISATSGTHAWRIDIGSPATAVGGDLHFKYGTNATSITNIVGFISKTPTSTGLMNFTGQHRCVPENEELYDNVNNYIGMVVEATGQYNSIDYITKETTQIGINTTPAHRHPTTNEWIEEYNEENLMRYKNVEFITTNEPSVNEAQPIVKLTTTKKSKKIYGVISAKEDGNNREFGVGCFISDLGARQDNRLFINSVGEGGILVNNENGNIENGDLLCSSSTPGIAMKQDSDFIMNYTIGKSTQDYNFIDNENKLIGCVYYCG